MKKGILTYIVSGALVLIAVAGMLLLSLLPAKPGSQLEPVNLYVEDITLNIGQTKTDFYQVSAENYEISFETDKEGVIEIDQSKIVAINSGKVKVDVKVEIDGNVIEESFYITVLAESFSYQFENLLNCTVEDGSIVLSSTTAQFSIKVFDENGLEIQNPTIDFVASEGIDARCEFKIFKITATQAGTISFSIAQTNKEFTVNIVLN